MKNLDLKPYEYRKQDPENGEMQHPLNRKMLRWMAVVVVAMLLYAVAAIGFDGGDWGAFLGMGVGGLIAGYCIGFSIRRPE